MLDPELMEEFVHTGEDPHNARTRVVTLENTHNHCGGRVLDPAGILAVRLFCDRHGLALHLDGARICNAAVASVRSLADMAAPFDSASVCLSKGLGAPVGSVLVGGAEFVKRARRARKLLGGGMRQAGILAAAGLFALRHNVSRLAEDHRRAHALAERLATVPGLSVELRSVETNMVFVSTRPSGRRAAEVAKLFSEAGALCLAESPWKIRFVTHLDVDDTDVAEAGEVVARTMASIA
jgi:threonine aldolase